MIIAVGVMVLACGGIALAAYRRTRLRLQRLQPLAQPKLRDYDDLIHAMNKSLARAGLSPVADWKSFELSRRRARLEPRRSRVEPEQAIDWGERCHDLRPDDQLLAPGGPK